MFKISKLKLSLIFAIFLILIVAISPANSFFWDDNSEPSTVTIGGIEFNIPTGYEYDEKMTSRVVDQLKSDSSSGFEENNGELKYFKDNSGNEIMIDTLDTSESELDFNTYYLNGFKPWQINGKDGYYLETSDHSSFNYINQGKLVSITVSDESILEDISK